MSPRIFSYIVIDLLPFRILSLPLITFSLFITLMGYIATEVFAHRYLLKNLIKLRIVIIIWSFILVVSALVNPLRDVVFEGQGMIVFMVNVIMFSIASVYLRENRQILISGIFLSIAGTIFVLNYILLTKSSLLPQGYSQANIRFEGLYSSTPIMGLVAISTAYLILYKKKSIKLIGLMGILISTSGLVMTATRSAIGASLIAFVVVTLFTLKIHKRSKKLLINVFLILLFVFFAIMQIGNLFPPLDKNIEYVVNRFNLLKESPYDDYRIIESVQELNLFIESPIFGHGYGLLNKYSIDSWGKPLFGHNFLTSLLSRTGLIGFLIIIWYGINLYKKMSFSRESVIARGALAGAIFLIVISNFSGFQTFGIYGAIAGIACGAYIEQKLKRS